MTIAAHGVNVGHGYMKYIIIDQHGNELDPVVFPALIAPAGRLVSGSIAQVAHVDLNGESYWTGDDALLSPTPPAALLAQTRLTDPVFIPALVRGALGRYGATLNGCATGYCVTGLPATWATDTEKAKALGARLREATAGYQKIRVIAEPLGLLYSQLLDNDGQVVGDPALQDGRWVAADWGHHTDDYIEVARMHPDITSLRTFPTGTARPLQQIRAHLSAYFERELSLAETDQAVRSGYLSVFGRKRELPMHWDRPLIENAHQAAQQMVELYGSGGRLDGILVGGGAAEAPYKVEAVKQYFDVIVADKPQTAIARGYGRLGRRTALAG